MPGGSGSASPCLQGSAGWGSELHQANQRQAPTPIDPYSGLTATLNVFPFTVRSCNVVALRRRPVSAPLAAGSVVVALAPMSPRSPNGPRAKRVQANSVGTAGDGRRVNEA